LRAECDILNFGYEVNLFDIKVEWNGEDAIVFLTDGVEDIELTTINFTNVATIIHYPRVYTQKPFQDMAEKHNLIKTMTIGLGESEE
jgi:serine phosphatase RsbU (regulator of sigma subunit)